MQRHVQHYNIDAKVGSDYSPVVSFEANALTGEQELWIKGRVERSALKYIGEDRNDEPDHDYSPYNERNSFECGGAEYPTVEDQDRKLDNGYRERVLKHPCKCLELDRGGT